MSRLQQSDPPPAEERDELARHIDDLLAQPAQERAPVTVVGDEAVFAVRPAPANRPTRIP
ncbi:MAG: hypothetical protein U1C74_25475 [Phenylobacterium sp.]|nr:hypothetical protein [Phenylobacterium sp.]